MSCNLTIVKHFIEEWIEDIDNNNFRDMLLTADQYLNKEEVNLLVHMLEDANINIKPSAEECLKMRLTPIFKNSIRGFRKRWSIESLCRDETFFPTFGLSPEEIERHLFNNSSYYNIEVHITSDIGKGVIIL